MRGLYFNRFRNLVRELLEQETELGSEGPQISEPRMGL